MTRVLTAGEALGVLRTSGTLADAPALEVGTGGAEANVAIGLARLGVACSFTGRVGDDGLGRRIAATLAAEGVETRLVVDPDAPTGLLLKERPGPGRTAVTYHRAGSAGSRLCADDIAALDLDGITLVHVTGITPALSASCAEAIDALIARARQAGAAVSFDVNHRSKLWNAQDAAPVYRRLIAAADIVFAGADEAALVTAASGDARNLARALQSLGAREAVVKLGSRGALARDGDDEASAAAVAVDVVDTVGAGDAFVAGYLAARLECATLAERLDLAVHTGAAACTADGDWEGAATRDRVDRLRRAARGRTAVVGDDEPVDR